MSNEYWIYVHLPDRWECLNKHLGIAGRPLYIRRKREAIKLAKQCSKKWEVFVDWHKITVKKIYHSKL